jgi:endonuclease YncB( thermonuclease family)
MRRTPTQSSGARVVSLHEYRVQRRKRRAASPVTAKLKLAAASLAVFTLTIAAGLSAPELPALAKRLSYRSIFVIDGDTIRLSNGERVRLLGIDAPEMPSRAKCAREASRAYAARDRLRELILHASELEMRPGGDQDRDVYGRQLRFLIIDGRDAGQTLMSEGLAQPWLGHPAHWC